MINVSCGSYNKGRLNTCFPSRRVDTGRINKDKSSFSSINTLVSENTNRKQATFAQCLFVLLSRGTSLAEPSHTSACWMMRVCCVLICPRVNYEMEELLTQI